MAKIRGGQIEQPASVLYVSPSYSEDGTNFFSSILSAEAVATASNIIVIRPGTYDETGIGKDQITYMFEAGAEIIKTANDPIFTDNGNAISITILGSGVFQGPNQLISFTNSASSIECNGRSLQTTNGVGNSIATSCSMVHLSFETILIGDSAIQNCTDLHIGALTIKAFAGVGSNDCTITNVDGQIVSDIFELNISASLNTNAFDVLTDHFEGVLNVTGEDSSLHLRCNQVETLTLNGTGLNGLQMLGGAEEIISQCTLSGLIRGELFIQQISGAPALTITSTYSGVFRFLNTRFYGEVGSETISIDADGLILQNCVIVSDLAQQAIVDVGAGGYDLLIYGILTTNTAMSATINRLVGIHVTDANVV